MDYGHEGDKTDTFRVSFLKAVFITILVFPKLAIHFRDSEIISFMTRLLSREQRT